MNFATTGYDPLQSPTYQAQCHEQQKKCISQNIQHHQAPALEAMQRFAITCRELANRLETKATYSGFPALLQCMYQLSTTFKRSLSSIFGFFSVLKWIRNRLLSSKHALLQSIEEFEYHGATKPITHLVDMSLTTSFALLCVGLSLFAAHLKAQQEEEEITEIASVNSEKNTICCHHWSIISNSKKLDIARAFEIL